jgi:hypothetical protein
VILGLGLSATAAFVAESVIFPKKESPKLRFVVLHHEGIDDPHFDLMLETAPDSPLATWRSPVWPINGPTTLTQLPDHRRQYLDYEGEISSNRGRVRRITTGTCSIANQPDGSTLIQFDHNSFAHIILRKIDAGLWAANPA